MTDEQQLTEPAPPQVEWFSAEVIDWKPPQKKQTTEGGSKVVAAWLRAVADEIDPPIRMTRSRTEPVVTPVLAPAVMLAQGLCPCGHGPAEHGHRGCASCPTCKLSSGAVGSMIAEAQ